MLKKRLNDYILLLHVKTKAEESDMNSLWELYLDETITTDERKNCIIEYANAFWVLCTKWVGFQEGQNYTAHIDKILKFVSYFSAIASDEEDRFYECKEVIFIKFLVWLRNRKDVYDTNQDNKFYDFYRKLNDVIGQVKWVFELEDSGEKVFPIHRLIEDAATEFELTEEHYLQLIFSLQLFNRVNHIGDDKESIKSKMLEIAEEFHIYLIKMLCDGGEILYGENAGINSAKNGTIVAIWGNEVLVRNVNRDYFNAEECKFEGENEENAIAFYYLYKREAYEEPRSFAFIMENGTNFSKQMVLKELMEKRIYNVFLGDVFWVNVQTNMYTRLINRFSENDDFLISEGKIVKEERTLYETFWNRIKRDQNGLRTSTIAQVGTINVLTLDFLVEYCTKLCNEDNTCLKILTDLSETDFFQNQLIKIYFDEELHNGRILDALRKYAKLISDYMNIEKVSVKTQFAEYFHLVMPYAIYVPFEGKVENLFESLKNEKYIDEEVIIEELKIGIGIGNIFEYKVANETILEDKIYSLSGINIESTKIKSGLCFYEKDKKQVYLLGEYEDVVDTIKNISKVASKFVIGNQWLNDSNHMNKLVTIITNIGFDNGIYNYLGTTYRDAFVSNIALYKLLWLMQVFQFDKVKYDKFEEMILKGFYCSFVLEPSKMMKKYLDEIEKLSKNNTLIIAKEPDGVGATLNLLIERYSNGDRGSLRMAFDGNTINRNLKIQDDEYFYMNVPISKIVFLTDNALSGKSTIDMLNYYLKKIRSFGNKRNYIFGVNSNHIPDVLDKNRDVKIIVKTIFYSERASERIKKEFPEYEISITGEMLERNKFNWTEEMNGVIQELFGNATEPICKSAQCVLRPCNLPHDKVLPDVLKDTTKLVGIFRRKED